MGDRVEAGQLLAEIDSPETDRELDQARANLSQTEAAYAQAQATVEQARANLVQTRTNSNFAHVSSNRWNALQQQGAVARQDFDEKKAAFDASTANVKAAESVVAADRSSLASAESNIQASAANVRRLEALATYKHITAPFSGIITARNVDSGALITAGSGGANAVWLYKVAQPDTLRVFVNLPQTFVQSVRPGQQADILVRELPKQVFKGRVTRTSSALDNTSHTLLTEVQVNNSDLKLLPGMYTQVKFVMQRKNLPLMIPANVIVVRGGKTQVAVVDANKTVHYQKVAIGRDNGTDVEITSGLTGTEQLVVNPTDEVTEGIHVNPVGLKPAKPEA
jgi:multidrug efflux system membrane fusion protein